MLVPYASLPALTRPPQVQEPDARIRHVPESVLHDLWGSLRFDATALHTTDGAAVTLLDPGRLNTHGGPDFTSARLRLTLPDGEPLVWTGDVEIHRTSGEWLLHRHDEDPHYDRVVLHVVLLADRHTGTLKRSDGTPLPELVLYPHLGNSLRALLHRFYAHPRPDFYCAAHWPEVPEARRRGWIRTLGLVRLREKAARLAEHFAHRPDLDALLYTAILRGLGYARNADAMTDLARRVPYILACRMTEARDVEALYFGVSGLLPEFAAMLHSDRHSADYVADLRHRFDRLAQRHDLAPMRPAAWQFFRLRPANFPTRRIAQAAALLRPADAVGLAGFLRHDPVGRLREALIARRPATVLRAFLRRDAPDPFWRTHVRFEQHTTETAATIGRSRADRLLMDAVLPVLLFDAEQRGDLAQEERAAAVLDTLPSSSDEITRRFEAHGTPLDSALITQGLHQLYRAWCTEGRCLSCRVGQAILERGEGLG